MHLEDFFQAEASGPTCQPFAQNHEIRPAWKMQPNSSCLMARSLTSGPKCSKFRSKPKYTEAALRQQRCRCGSLAAHVAWTCGLNPSCKMAPPPDVGEYLSSRSHVVWRSPRDGRSRNTQDRVCPPVFELSSTSWPQLASLFKRQRIQKFESPMVQI